jgi:hypothetical protein
MAAAWRLRYAAAGDASVESLLRLTAYSPGAG